MVEDAVLPDLHRLFMDSSHDSITAESSAASASELALRTASITPSRSFLDLPAEIRVEIYKCCLLPDNCHNRHARRRHGYLTKEPMALFDNVMRLSLVCRLISKEVVSTMLEFFELDLMHTMWNVAMGLRDVWENETFDSGQLPNAEIMQSLRSKWKMISAAASVRSCWITLDRSIKRTLPMMLFMIVKQNPYHWQKLEMIANGRTRVMEHKSDNTNMDILRKTLKQILRHHEDIKKFIWIGSSNGLQISVLLRIQDRVRGKIACTVRMAGGDITILKQHESMPDEGTLKRLFGEVFASKKRRSK